VDSIHYGRPADFSGNHVVGVPEHTYAVSLGWTPPALSWFDIRAGVQGASAYFCDDANQVRVPAYRIATLTLATATPLGLGANVAIRGFITVQNLFDRPYISSAFLNPDEVGGQPIAFEPGLPRNMVVGLSLERRSAPRP
jgi:outer membrane receptor protein involved in Fe transport